MLDGGGVDLLRIIETQVAVLAAQSAALNAASASLFAVQRALAAGRNPDLDTFCTLIKQRDSIMTDQAAWQKVADRYFSPDEQVRWSQKLAQLPKKFDSGAYRAK